MFSPFSVSAPDTPATLYWLWLRPLRSCTSEPLTPSAQSVHTTVHCKPHCTPHCTQLLKLHPEETEERGAVSFPSTPHTQHPHNDTRQLSAHFYNSSYCILRNYIMNYIHTLYILNIIWFRLHDLCVLTSYIWIPNNWLIVFWSVNFSNFLFRVFIIRMTFHPYIFKMYNYNSWSFIFMSNCQCFYLVCLWWSRKSKLFQNFFESICTSLIT